MLTAPPCHCPAPGDEDLPCRDCDAPACTCTDCHANGCDDTCPTCCPPEPEQDEPVDESAEWRAHELAHAAGEV